MKRTYISEFIATFIMIFAGCGAMVIDAMTGSLGHIGIALTWGFVVVAMIYTFEHISGAQLQAFIMEFILTFILMIVIFGSAVHGKAVKEFAGLAIGLTVGLEAMFAGPITNVSMNPTRSIAPALVSGNLNDLWLYIVAPICGAIVAGFVFANFIKCKNSDECLI